MKPRRRFLADSAIPTVYRYMADIQLCARDSVRSFLKSALQRVCSEPPRSVDKYMEDKVPVQLAVSISPDVSAAFNSTGTGPHIPGNTNGSMVMTNSAMIYCLRALVAFPIPLEARLPCNHQGCRPGRHPP